jgi:hypothetical protein
MNVHLKPLSFKKYSLTLIYTFLFIGLMISWMEIYFERIYGDLTRLGNFPERYFGWQYPQPSISPDLFKDYSFNEADILVIGDSFSIGRTWQTKLVSEGLKVGTMHWGELKTKSEAMPSDLGNALRTSGFKGRYVVIESVERLFQDRMKALSEVQNPPFVKKAFVINSDFPLYPFNNRELFSWNKLNGGEWGFKALYNSIKLFLNLPDGYLKSGMSQAIKFDGCDFFSHRLCNYALFVDGDFKKGTFTSIDNVLEVNKSLQQSGIQPIWVIVPDKATIYLGYGKLNKQPYQNIWQLFSQHPELTAPDLGTAFVDKSRKIKDLYLSNDTHLGVNGFLYMGDIVAKEIQNLNINKTKLLSP